MAMKNKKFEWAIADNSKEWEFLSAPNFKSLTVLATAALLSLTSNQAMAADYNYGTASTSFPAQTQQQVDASNPNYTSALTSADRAYIGANARLEDTRAVVENYADSGAVIIPMNQRPGYFTRDGGSTLTGHELANPTEKEK